MDEETLGRLMAHRSVLAALLKSDTRALALVTELVDLAEVVGAGEQDGSALMRLASFHSELETLLDLARRDPGAGPGSG